MENFNETTKVPYIKLQSSEGEVFTIETEIAKKSGTLCNMLEDLGVEKGEDNEEAVPLPNVNTYILEKVLQWSSHNKDGTPVDSDVLRVEQGTLFEITLAANYVKIKGLSDVTAVKAVANMIEGKSPEEIRDTFNIKNDFDPAEEEQIRKALFRYSISKGVNGWGGQLLTFADKVGGWGWPNADVSKKLEKKSLVPFLSIFFRSWLYLLEKKNI